MNRWLLPTGAGVSRLVMVKSPSCPLVLSPQQSITPVANSPHACSPPTLMVTKLTPPGTGTAVLAFDCQHSAAPFAVRPHPKPPTLTSRRLLPCITEGDASRSCQQTATESARRPQPKSPTLKSVSCSPGGTCRGVDSPSPQHNGLPEKSSPQENPVPASTFRRFSGPTTTGWGDGLILSSLRTPTAPAPLSPQQ
jgi:hypothetical protein